MICKLTLKTLSAAVLFTTLLFVLAASAQMPGTSRSMDSQPQLFLPVVTYDSGAVAAGSIVVADVNGDGKPDLVVADSAEVGVLLGNGDGTFESAMTYSAPGGAIGLAVADLNGDGKLDIIVTGINGGSNGDGSVEVLLGNGNGTFQPAVSYDSGGPSPYALTVADFNRDGKLDVVVADCSPYTGSSCGLFGVLLGNGDGTFQPVVTYNSGGVGAWSVTTADLNGDGNPDLVVGNLCPGADCRANGVVAVFLGNGDGTFKAPATYDSGGRTLDVAVSDVNGDGKNDLVVLNGCDDTSHCTRTSNTVGVLLGNGDGSFRPALTYEVGEKNASSLSLGDVNGDGKPDVVVADCTPGPGRFICETNGLVSVLLGNGDGTLQQALTYGSGGERALGVAVADLNGDGSPDIVVTNCAPAEGSCDGSANGVVGVLMNNTAPHSPSATTLVSNANPAATGQVVTYTATVTSQYSGTITGTVTFYDRKAIIATLPVASGQAAFSTSYEVAGSHDISASYSGDLHNTASVSGTLTEYIRVFPIVSKTTLATSGTPSMVGQSVTFTATVSSKFGTPPDGEFVTFYDGKALLGSVALTNGVAAYSTSSLSAKTHTIKAVYAGDQTFKPSSGSLKQVVEQ